MKRRGAGTSAWAGVMRAASRLWATKIQTPTSAWVGRARAAASSWAGATWAALLGLALVAALGTNGCGGAGGDGANTAAVAGEVGGTGGAAAADTAANASGATGAASTATGTGAADPEVIMLAPDLPDLELVDQAGAPVSLRELRGKPTLLTFIYVNCPMPEMCPATTLRFQDVQRALDEQMRERVRLISVSFDPADTPEVLAEYAELWEVDPRVWTMLTGPEESVQALGAAYGFWFETQEGGTFRHAMISVILLPDGSMHRVLLGSVWDGAEVADNLARLVAARGEPAPH